MNFFQFSLQFKLQIVLITEEREDAQQQAREGSETAECVKDPDTLLVCSFTAVEIEQEELVGPPVDGLSQPPPPGEVRDDLQADEEEEEEAVAVAEQLLGGLVLVQVQVQSQGAAQGEGDVDLGEEGRGTMREPEELGDHEDHEVQRRQAGAGEADGDRPELEGLDILLHKKDRLEVH